MLPWKCLFIFAYLYLKIINVASDEGITLAFAIDDTGSMYDDIAQVQRAAGQITDIVLRERSSEVKDFVLVTINDPGVVNRINTTSSVTFRSYLNSIYIHDGGDCPEMSLTGIETAILASRPGSQIYVFTDASAKDYHLVDRIKSLCQQRQAQVVFVLTGDCGSPSDIQYTVYPAIAVASSGQVFRVPKDQVSSVMEFVKTMVKGKHSAIKSIIQPASASYVPIPFTIDDKADYVVISTSGVNVQLWVDMKNNEKIVWKDNIKVLKVSNLSPGTYNAWVMGHSEISIVIYARTDFTFEHGFSNHVPTSIKDTSKQPTAGRKQHLSIVVTDPEHAVAVESLEILDMKENVIGRMPLRKIGDNFYMANDFESPAQMFKIAVNGKIKSTNKPIRRISKTPVEPISEPPVIINNKSVYMAIEGDTVLPIPCNVTGYPTPVIVWKKNGNVIQKGVKYDIKGNVLYINNPTMALDTGHVTCEARNKLGAVEKNFETYVRETLDIDGIPKKRIDVNERKTRTIKIKCALVNSETSSVRWYMDGEKTNQTGSTYVIEHATVSNDGNYTCRVNTKEGPKSETYVVDVGLPPTFENEKPSPITIDWNDDEVLDCMEQSKPEAKIVWTHNGNKVESLNKRNIKVTDWGEHQCTVSNVHGTIQRTFKVVSSGCYLRGNMATQNMPLLTQVNTPSLPNLISNSDIELKKREKVKLSCPTATKSANVFQTLPTKTEVIAECDTEDKFIVDGKTYRFKDLQCNTKVEPSVVKTPEQCSGPNTEMMKVGFAVNGFLDAYKVCYDRSKNVPVYASSLITLSKSGNGVDASKFKWSPSLGLGDGKPTGGYTCGTSKKCCYEKSQLVNVNELAFGPTQAATFKENINSIAVWNPCDGSGRTYWKNFEEELKSISFMYGSWSTSTGASTYTNKNGGLVPRYIWKVMNYDGESSVMVYVNDESPVNSDIKCTQPCESMMESADKFLYCCTLDEFSKVFGISSDKFTA